MLSGWPWWKLDELGVEVRGWTCKAKGPSQGETDKDEPKEEEEGKGARGGGRVVKGAERIYMTPARI